MEKASNIVVKILAIALLTAAVLKGWLLLTEPVANNDIWSYRPFLILTVEFELALGIWLLSGLFKKAAWLATLLCFSVFSAITLYKGITGAESCGCFGPVHVNPWMTLFAIELPAVIALSIFRPNISQVRSVRLFRLRLTAVIVIALTIGIPTGIAMAMYEPAVLIDESGITGNSHFVVLEPMKWIGKRFPILGYIEPNDNLAYGKWIVVFYYHGCSDCRQLIPRIKNLVCMMSIDNLNLAFIEIPPYKDHISEAEASGQFIFGRLSNNRDWFVKTPTVILIIDDKVNAVWEKHLPDAPTLSMIIRSTGRNRKNESI